MHENINENIPPLKKLKLIKIAKNKEDEVTIIIQIANKSWNDWKFQINLNKL